MTHVAVYAKRFAAGLIGFVLILAAVTIFVLPRFEPCPPERSTCFYIDPFHPWMFFPVLMLALIGIFFLVYAFNVIPKKWR